MSGQLSGKVAIVTGGSRGIGLGIAKRFAEEGARVVTTARRAPEYKAAERSDVLFVAADVSDPKDVANVFRRTLQHFGGLDILVNNAGIQFQKSVEETTEAEWDAMMAVNVKSMFLCIKAALGPMRERKGGSIINIGSYDGFVADPNFSAYCASKGAVHSLTRAVAVDVGKDRIRCNVICPGWIETEMLKDYYDHLPDPVAARTNIASLHPIGRVGQPSDIAALAVWLASNESAFCTGQEFVVDGGFTARAPQPS
jgi:meso-butanediol dehydrogenase / (S,S)-butanediol dehydrogenase / diacetyl reductase